MLAPAACFLALALSAPFRVAGYLPEWEAARFDTGMAQGLTDVILFSAEASADGTLDTSKLEGFPWSELYDLRKVHGTRLTFAVGGWGRCVHLPGVAADAAKRTTFANAVNAVCDKYKLDGIDFDWEHPKNSKEEADYGKLVEVTKKSFRGKDRTTSLTIAGWQKLPKSVFAFVDFLQVMSYDHEGKHATMEDSVKDLDLVAALGAKPSQTVLGLPFYGRKYRNGSGEATYASIAAAHDLKAGNDTAGDFYFNGRDTIANKVKLARKRKLAGVMIWEIGQDATGPASLLDSILVAAKR